MHFLQVVNLVTIMKKLIHLLAPHLINQMILIQTALAIRAAGQLIGEIVR
jgi:DNA-binding transcriptional regulator YdaS (Cro superfamily)